MTKNFFSLALIFLCAVSSYAQAPTITSFSPMRGGVGILVTITGSNLSSPTAFTIGGVAAVTVSATDTTLVGMVMPGAATGKVFVTTLGGSAKSGRHFTVTAPVREAFELCDKLVGKGASGYDVTQGYSTGLSADGTTALIGGPNDGCSINHCTGAAWVYSRSGAKWTEQGTKLVDTGALIQNLHAGSAVALSADGNTALICGGQGDMDGAVVRVYNRVGTRWVKQGTKLGGVTEMGTLENYAVALSADGNTAIVGGTTGRDTGDINLRTIDAVWIYSRLGTTWTLQKAKSIGTGTISYVMSVALSADGNTAIVGTPHETLDSFYNHSTGAAWVFLRSGGTWVQQGPKLVGSEAGTDGEFGWSVSLSADGNTAIIGGIGRNNGAGAAWVFVRSGETWVQQGPMLVGNGGTGSRILFGNAVSLSADGNTAIVGGPLNNDDNRGAAWMFSRSGSRWTQLGPILDDRVVVSSAASGGVQQGQSVFISADGNTAIVGGPGHHNNGAAWIYSRQPKKKSH